MCHVPALTMVEDIVCVIKGYPMGVVLRPKGQHYELVGECYVHGMMHGEDIYEASRFSSILVNKWIDIE